MKNLTELRNHIQLKPLPSGSFLGHNQTVGSPTVFGGQVLAQALYAAYRIIDNQKMAHSMHAYFLLPGQLGEPIEYQPELIRKGGSFSTVRVKAIQNQKTIFITSISFQLDEAGYEYQMPMTSPEKMPDELISWEEIYQQSKDFLPTALSEFLAIPRPFEFRPMHINNPFEKKVLPPYSHVWLRGKEESGISFTQEEWQEMLTYISDYNILAVTLHPHAEVAHYGNTQMASIDHSIYFHRTIPANQWLLYELHTPSSSNGRGFAQGKIYTQDGVLIASVSQEGLIRPLQK